MLLYDKKPFQGMYEDISARIPYYFDDFSNCYNLKVLASILYIFFTSLFPAITFAYLLEQKTDQNIGVIEVMLSVSICGCLFALFSGQPLVIVGVTGPISILTISIFTMANDWGLNFLPFYAWSQIWGGILCCLMAAFNLSSYVKWISRFSCEIFGILIALIYIYEGVFQIVNFFEWGGFDSGIWQLFICLGMLYTATFLSTAVTEWVVFNSFLRELISDYSASISVFIWSALTYIPGAINTPILRLQLPNQFQTTANRSWLVDLSDIPTWGIFAAILPGLIIAVLFYFDHNVSALMAQDEHFKLKKPSAYHWDLFLLGK